MDLKICRLCCANSGTIRLFDGEGELARQLIYLCVRISVAEGDGLPAKICIGCESELARCSQFVLQAEASDRNLWKTLEETLHVKKEQEETKYAPYGSYRDEFDSPDFSSSPIQVETKPIGIKQENNDVTESSKKRIFRRSKKVKSNVCATCGRVCTNRCALVSHMRMHNNEKPHICPHCSKQFKAKGSLKGHIERVHKEGASSQGKMKKYVCETCGKIISRKYNIDIHMRTHTGETPYSCPICPAKFKQQSSLIRHEARHSGTKPFHCSSCNKCFSTKDQLRTHMHVHTTEKKYTCPICQGQFKYQNNLTKHIKLHDQQSNFVCNYCGRLFRAKGNLKSHIEKQHSERSGQCNICFKTVPNIEVHMRKHTGERPLKCELCPSTFFEQNGLAHHINFRHKNQDKYKCLYKGCTESFPSQPMLDFHQSKLHTGTLPFTCERCPRAFYRKNDLARHMIGTHKERLK